MAKHLDYIQNLEQCIEFGQICKHNRKHKACVYAVSNLGIITQITYYCSRCNTLQDTLYNTSWYLQACHNLNLDDKTLTPLASKPTTKE